MDGQTDGRSDGRTDGRTDGRMDVFPEFNSKANIRRLNTWSCSKFQCCYPSVSDERFAENYRDPCTVFFLLFTPFTSFACKKKKPAHTHTNRNQCELRLCCYRGLRLNCGKWQKARLSLSQTFFFFFLNKNHTDKSAWGVTGRVFFFFFFLFVFCFFYISL